MLEIILLDIKLDSLSTIYYVAPTSAVMIGIG
jgi:hypothetical protein